MLAVFVTVYLIVTVLIGFYASKRIHDSTDFALAGRRLPFFMSTAALFATWFGSETIVGASEEFLEKGILGIIEEPLGASLCLMLVGIFYAKRIYNENELTFSDIFRKKVGKSAEYVSALVMIPSFFTWIAAQLLALGMVLQLVFNIPITAAILIGSILVVAYTVVGGMWAISITDTIQMVVIIVGMIICLILVSWNVDLSNISKKLTPGFFNVYDGKRLNLLEWVSAWVTVGLGSVASQDIHQRICSSKSAKTAKSSSIASGFLYLIIGFIPLIIALIGKVSYPELYEATKGNFISSLIRFHMPEWVQILFFGALISAILSTASGAILAPSTILTDNILKYRFKKVDTLLLMRISILIVSVISVALTFTHSSVFQLVSLSSSFGLVSLFVPFTYLMFWRNPLSKGAVFGMISGIVGWILGEIFITTIPAGLTGTFISFMGVVIGHLLQTRMHRAHTT